MIPAPDGPHNQHLDWTRLPLGPPGSEGPRCPVGAEISADLEPPGTCRLSRDVEWPVARSGHVGRHLNGRAVRSGDDMALIGARCPWDMGSTVAGMAKTWPSRDVALTQEWRV